ncbi:hypothetical protein [Hydrogenobacter thermophilus]|nr:hypothetical protein [Hydrogenobacter thermophilus]
MKGLKVAPSAQRYLRLGQGRSRGGVNPPVVVRHPEESVNPPEALHL